MKKIVKRPRVLIGRKQKPVEGILAVEIHQFSGDEHEQWHALTQQGNLVSILDGGISWAKEALAAKGFAQPGGLSTDFPARLLSRVKQKPISEEAFAVKVLRAAISVHQHIAKGDPYASARAMHAFTWNLVWAGITGSNNGNPSLEALALAGYEQTRTGKQGGAARAENYQERDERIRERANGIRQHHPDWKDSSIANEIGKKWESVFPGEKPLVAETIRKIIAPKK